MGYKCILLSTGYDYNACQLTIFKEFSFHDKRVLNLCGKVAIFFIDKLGSLYIIHGKCK